MFEIEKNIPIPPRKRRALMYPVKDMDIGDSFFISFDTRDKRDTRLKRSRVSSAIKQAGEGKKFTTRTVDGGIRTWRIK